MLTRSRVRSSVLSLYHFRCPGVLHSLVVLREVLDTKKARCRAVVVDADASMRGSTWISRGARGLLERMRTTFTLHAHHCAQTCNKDRHLRAHSNRLSRPIILSPTRLSPCPYEGRFAPLPLHRALGVFFCARNGAIVWA